MRRLPAKADAVEWNPDGRRLAVVCDGSVTVWSAAGEPLTTLQAMNRGRDWVISTPEGYAAASPGAAREVRWRWGGALLGGAALRRRFLRPDQVARAVLGVSGKGGGARAAGVGRRLSSLRKERTSGRAGDER